MSNVLNAKIKLNVGFGGEGHTDLSILYINTYIKYI